MGPHVHVSAIDGVVTLCYVIIGTAALRALAGRWPDSAFARGLAGVFS